MHPVDHIRKFGGSTSMHGAPRVILTKSKTRRVLWLTIFLATWTIFGINLYFLFERYFSFKRRASVDIVDEGVPFPWITLCPMSGLDFYTVARIKELLQVPSVKDRERRMAYYESLLNRLGAPGHTAADEYIKELVSIFYIVAKEDTRSNISIKKLREMYETNSLFANMPQSTIEQNFMSMKQFVVSCQNSELECNATDFLRQFNMQYQNCFTYAYRSQLESDETHEEEGDKEGEVTDGIFSLLSKFFSSGNDEEEKGEEADFAALKEGVEAGWSAVVLSGRGIIDRDEDFNDDKYQIWIGTVHDSISPNKGGTGVRVVIHAPNTTALPMAEGYDVPPGYSASFAIKLGENRRLSEPYGKCSDHSPYEDEPDLPYREINCIIQCVQEEIAEKCGCIDSTQPILSDYLKQRLNNKTCVDKKNAAKNLEIEKINSSLYGSTENLEDLSTEYDVGCLHYCRQFRGLTLNETWQSIPDFSSYYEKLECGNRVRKELLRDVRLRQRCHCHPACEEYTYDVSYSLSKWPKTGYEGLGIYRDIFFKRQFHQHFNTSVESYKMFYSYAFKNQSKMLKDFSRINVYIEDNSVVVTEEVPDYTVVQLLSDIGGQLGIWVGVSFLTVSEVIETMFLICRDTARLFCRKSQNANKTKDGQEVVGLADAEKEEKKKVDDKKKVAGVVTVVDSEMDGMIDGSCPSNAEKL